jgi:hypothetical protein
MTGGRSNGATKASSGKVVRYECNFRDLRLRNPRLTEQIVAEAAGIKRDLYHAMENGFCDALTQRVKYALADEAAGLKPRKVRIAEALGVAVIDLVCKKLETPYIYERPKKAPKPVPQRRFDIRAVEEPKPREIAEFPDYHVATVLSVLSENIKIPALTASELMFIIAAVREREVIAGENNPRFVLTRIEVAETVAAARTVILDRRP